jgi:hypothetical protein
MLMISSLFRDKPLQALVAMALMLGITAAGVTAAGEGGGEGGGRGGASPSPEGRGPASQRQCDHDAQPEPHLPARR